MPTSNTEELGRFLKCTVIGRGVFGPCACWIGRKSRDGAEWPTNPEKYFPAGHTDKTEFYQAKEQ